MNIIFAKKECQVLNITDVTSVIKLEREREKYRLMKKLNTSVHHEMIAPLRAQMIISKSLAKSCTELKSKQMAKLMTLSSNLLLLHAQDLLD